MPISLKLALKLTLIFVISSVISTVFSTAAWAQPQAYWVLGSFRAEENAEQERQRLESRLAVAIEFRVAPSGLLRLVVPAERLSQSTVDLLGIGAWKIVLPEVLLEVQTVEVPLALSEGLSEESSENMPDIIHIIASPALLELPDIQQGQSLSGYCGSLPGQLPSFCEPQKLASIKAKLERLEVRMSALSDYCAHPGLVQDLVEVCRHLPR
jgi:hypothetical protein